MLEKPLQPGTEKTTFIVIYKKGRWENEHVKEFVHRPSAERFHDKQITRGWLATVWERTVGMDANGTVWVDID